MKDIDILPQFWSLTEHESAWGFQCTAAFRDNLWPVRMLHPADPLWGLDSWPRPRSILGCEARRPSVQQSASAPSNRRDAPTPCLGLLGCWVGAADPLQKPKHLLRRIAQMHRQKKKSWRDLKKQVAQFKSGCTDASTSSSLHLPPKLKFLISYPKKLFTLHVHNQQCVANSQRCPESEGLCGRKEVLIDDRYGGQHGHQECDGHNPAQQRQQIVSRWEEADANAAVALWAVELEQCHNMSPQELGLSSQEPAESRCQNQA